MSGCLSVCLADFSQSSCSFLFQFSSLAPPIFVLPSFSPSSFSHSFAFFPSFFDSSSLPASLSPFTLHPRFTSLFRSLLPLPSGQLISPPSIRILRQITFRPRHR